MITFKPTPLKDFIKSHSPTNPTQEVIERFSKEIELFLQKANTQDDEEFQKNEINKLLAKVYGYDCNTKGKIDSAIYVDGEAQVLIEVKALKNTAQFPTQSTLVSKALCESILYFLREKGDPDISHRSNNSIKHIILCNPYEFYIFDATSFETFLKDKTIEKLYKNCDGKEGTNQSTETFYKGTEAYLNSDFEGVLPYTHFSLKDNLSIEELSLIYQLLSPQVLLKEVKTLDANTLNKGFYEELLYILGLQEVSENGKSGGKILIILSKRENTLSSEIKRHYKLNDEEIFTLLTTWNNRILFLRLLESMLLSFQHISKPFLDLSIIKDFKTLQTLFFEVLAKKSEDRSSSLPKELYSIPYLNSSLFDPIALEREGKHIGGLDSMPVALFSHSILRKDKRFKDRESLPLLEYLFEFLHAYDFTTTAKDIAEGVKQNHDKLINSAVLGLVFEKLNGYKEGSFYTPSFITSYMCKESITEALIEKFNSTYSWKCENLQKLKERIEKEEKISDEEFLNTLLSLKICDPSVGSGHFLVSALNELVLIAHTLRIFSLPRGVSLELDNDEILIKTREGIFAYCKPRVQDEDEHIIQTKMFTLKKSIIENCLFGVDINPNSCEITKLRLWIELLKYSYYIFNEKGENTNALETLPNIDINIKCGNSLISNFPLDSNLTIGQTKSFSKNLKTQIQNYKDSVMLYKEGMGEKAKILQDIASVKSLIISYLLEQNKANTELKESLKAFIRDYGDESFDINTDFGMQMLKTAREQGYKFTPTLTSLEPAPLDKNAHKLLEKIQKSYEVLENLKTSNAFEWRFEFPEVLDEEGNFLGFDVVIGNPPYIRIQEMQSLVDFYRKKYASCAKDAFDICILFLYQSVFLLRNEGSVSLILSNKFFKNRMGEGIRDFITQNSFLQKIIDFGTNQVFASATTYTGIITLKKAYNENFLYKEFALDEDFHNLNAIQFNLMKNSLIDYSPWSFENSDLRKIIEKLKNQKHSFGEITEKIAKGSSSGNDEIFLVDLIREDNEVCLVESKRSRFKIEKDLLVPFLYGEDVKRLEKCKPTKFLIYPYDKINHKFIGINILNDKYPLALKYFSSVKDELMQRSLKTSNDDFYKYSALRNAKTYQNNKILIPDFLVCGRFGYDNIGLWHNASIHGIKLREEFLDFEKMYLGILNSSLFWFFVSATSTALRGDAYRLTPSFISPFSFPQITESNQPIADKIIALVEEILKVKEQDPSSSTQELESQIDSLVYTLYGLSEEEIKIIENKE